ncbi:MAG: radical SAM protein [Candidatus Cloacimonetes bacterium]|nr:radical SAM protein [Candidatus Cloacimonadota bacterium]
MKINEIFYSIQGESTHAGRPCIFIRTSGCKLRCSWCDTKYSYSEGDEYTFDALLDHIDQYDCKLVELTGGEPLEQSSSYALLEVLLQRGYEVLLETGGHCSLEKVPSGVKKIVDIKCPASLMHKTVLWDNLRYIDSNDELKFVIQDRADFDWAIEVIEKYSLKGKCCLLFSAVFEVLPRATLAKWICEEAPFVRFQMQFHKVIWDSNLRGV